MNSNNTPLSVSCRNCLECGSGLGPDEHVTSVVLHGRAGYLCEICSVDPDDPPREAFDPNDARDQRGL